MGHFYVQIIDFELTQPEQMHLELRSQVSIMNVVVTYS